MAITNRLQIVGGAQAQGLSLSTQTQRARVPRYPKHAFNIVQKPYEITPFHISPVLAGETLRNALLQCRTVSTTLKNRLIGHHLEHYLFYVRLRDLADAEDLVSMLMQMDSAASAAVDRASGSKAEHYVRLGAPDYVKMCLDAVTHHYFRDEGDDTPHVGATGLPIAQWSNYKSIIESMIDDTDMATNDVSDETPFPEFEKEYATWQYMRQMQLTEVSFEDYLGTFGVRTPNAELNRPELIRMVKNWTYPTNTLDGEGNINTQASWSIQERADKDRFFKEPGFIFGVSVARPKVYLSQQDQSAVSALSDAFSWLPALMKDQPMTSLKKLVGNSPEMPLISTAAPTGGELVTTGNYWFDVRDLFLYGDQFVNNGRTSANNAIPAEDLTDFHGKKYPDVAALQTLGSGDTLSYESDGIVSFNILGTQIDAT